MIALCDLSAYHVYMKEYVHVKRLGFIAVILLMVLVAVSIGNLTKGQPEPASVLKAYAE